MLPLHVHLVDIVGSVALEEGVGGVNAFVGFLGSNSILAMLRGEVVV